jgi:N6-L-threonylcarbamoyladenine synthase
MKILAIETSCDETAISILEAEGGFENPRFKILGNNLLSQIEIHKEYGGVYPTLAKREHAKNLVPILEKTLKEAGMLNSGKTKMNEELGEILKRESRLLEKFLKSIPNIKKPDIDYIAVTQGPGLEPALWVGINFAEALSLVWDIPLIPVNHMEGHMFSPLSDPKNKVTFPSLALLISGGHTELVLMKDWFKYETLGETQDDAVGEAFDKVARMMGLPYPGGPEISKIAEEKRSGEFEKEFNLPKPMINSPNCHFSFSGLKTAVLYRLKDLDLDEKTKAQMAREFEDTVVDILIHKTKKALGDVKTLIIGGGVIANSEIRKAFKKLAEEKNINLLIPEMSLTTDNAVMIGIAGYFRALENPKGSGPERITANGNLRLA